MKHSIAAQTVISIAAFLLSSGVMATELPTAIRQPTASSATGLTCTQDSSGRWRIIGNLVNSNNVLSCGLALASGRCVFTCGPGSPRCEGGSDSLPLGGFDLFNLPTESDGTIILQTFVSGNIPGRQTINPNTCAGGSSGGGTARWTTYESLCCSSGTLTFKVTINGVTKTSVSSSCSASPTVESLTTIPAGTYSASASSVGCGSSTGQLNVTLSADKCYAVVHTLNSSNQEVVGLSTLTCPSSEGGAVPLSTIESAVTVPESQMVLPENQSEGRLEKLKQLP